MTPLPQIIHLARALWLALVVMLASTVVLAMCQPSKPASTCRSLLAAKQPNVPAHITYKCKGVTP